MTYDISPFNEWINDLPDDLGEDENTPSVVERGIRDDAPPEAKKAYEEFLQAHNSVWKFPIPPEVIAKYEQRQNIRKTKIKFEKPAKLTAARMMFGFGRPMALAVEFPKGTRRKNGRQNSK